MTGVDVELELLVELAGEPGAACPVCRGSLRGMSGRVCPGCGTELSVRVGLVENRLGWWIAGVTGLAVGVGFDGFIGILYTVFLKQSSSVSMIPSVELAFRILTWSGVVMTALLVVWLTQRRRLRRLEMSKQRVLVLLCWGLVLVPIGYFFGMVIAR